MPERINANDMTHEKIRTNIPIDGGWCPSKGASTLRVGTSGSFGLLPAQRTIDD
jgi:hypothetical protein